MSSILSLWLKDLAIGHRDWSCTRQMLSKHIFLVYITTKYLEGEQEIPMDWFLNRPPGTNSENLYKEAKGPVEARGGFVCGGNPSKSHDGITPVTSLIHYRPHHSPLIFNCVN